MKTKLAATGILLAVVLTCLVGFSALAQNASPAAPVGPGNTDTTKKMLANALTPETRQTLQQAMDSVDPTTLLIPGTALTLGPGEAAELDGAKADRIAFASLPAPVRNALSGDAHHALSGSAGP